MHIASDNTDFADYLLNSTKPTRNKFFERIVEHKNCKRMHQLGLTPVVTLVRLSQEEINAYKSSKNNIKNIKLNMSHKSNNNNKETEASKSITNKKYLDLFGENKSLKIHPNKLVHRSHSKHSTKEIIVKDNKDIRKSNYEPEKNIFKNKDKYHKDRKEDKTSSRSSSKTKSHKTENKCESRHRNSNDNKNSGSKIKETQSTSKDIKKHYNTKKNSTDTQNEINLSKLDIKNTNAKLCSSRDKLKTDENYKPKKITERRRSHVVDNKVPYIVKEEESTLKRRNSQTSSKTTHLECDKKLNILQTNKQLTANNSPVRKRLSSTSSDVYSDKENLTKHSPEKILKLSSNPTKTPDTKKESNNVGTTETKKRSISEVSIFSYEIDKTSASKRSNSLGFSAFSSLADDAEVIAIDKTKILPPINDLNSPYVSFGDFLKNQNLPVIESSPKGPEFSCTQLEGDKLLIKKRELTNNAIVIDIADDDDDEPSSIEVIESSPKLASKNDCDVKIKQRNIIEIDEGASDFSNKGTTQTSSKVTPESNFDTKINVESDNNSESSSNFNDKGENYKEAENNTSLVGRADDGYKNSSDSVNKRSKQEASENSSKNDCDVNKTNIVENSKSSNENSSISNNKRKTEKTTESSPEISSKKDCIKKASEPLTSNNETSSDTINNRTIERYEADSVSSKETKKDFKTNNKSDKVVNQKIQILITEHAVEYITSDMVSILNVYVDYKEYTERLALKKGSNNKEINNKDIFIKNRLKFLKSLCKKMQSTKVYSFKTAFFFDILIESIKIHIAPKEVLNEKTIIRFIHNVLLLLMENCTSPNDHYMLYNHVVSAKSLQYLDQKSCFLSDSINKQIFDCMNSFSIKLERPKDSSSNAHKDNAPQIYCINDSPNKITDITPGNSLPCINTGENSVTKISAVTSSDIPQISIADSTSGKDNAEENLIDILEVIQVVTNMKKPCVIEKNTNNQIQMETTGKSNTDTIIESIESKLVALFNEEPPANMEKLQDTNCETSVAVVDSQNLDKSDNMNFLKNINPNKSYLAPNEQNFNLNGLSSVSYQTSIDNVHNSISITPIPYPIVKTNKDASNKNIKILNDIVVTPATKQIPFHPQSKLAIQETHQPTTKQIAPEMNSESMKINSPSVIVSSLNTHNLTPSNEVKKKIETENKTKVTKRPYVRRKLLPETNKKTSNSSDRQLLKEYSHIENRTILPKQFSNFEIQNKPYIPTKVAMTDYLKNSESGNVPTNSSPSCKTNQITQVSNYLPQQLPISSAPTTSTYLHRQYSAPVQVQQNPLNSLSQLLSHMNPVPLSRQSNAPSQLRETSSRSPASTITQPLYIPSLLPKSALVDHQKKSFTVTQLPEAPPPPIISEQPCPQSFSTSKTVSRSSFTSLGAPSPLKPTVPLQHGEITHKVTFVHEFSTQTVHTQQKSNTPSYEQYAYEKYLQEKERQEFRSKLAEQERQKHQQELLLIQQKQAQERLRHQQYQQRQQQQQQQLQEFYRLQKQEMMNNNCQNMTTMYNRNLSGHMAQSNEYTYLTYHSGYPVMCDKAMPQMIHNSVNVHGGTINYLNDQETRNTVPMAPMSAQRCNNNLIYPPITYAQPNAHAIRNVVTTDKYFMQSNARSPNNVPTLPTRNNTVIAHTSNTSHQIGNEEQLLRATLRQKETQPNANLTVEQHLSELEDLLNIPRNSNGKRGANETNISLVRNSSRDSGYMTPTKQKDQTCAYCLGVGSFICSGCVTVYYCSENCQTKAWPSHQDFCYIEE